MTPGTQTVQIDTTSLTIDTRGIYQGAAQHTYTAICDGFHEPGQCAGKPHVVAPMHDYPDEDAPAYGAF